MKLQGISNEGVSRIAKSVRSMKNVSNKRVAFSENLKDILNQLTDEMGPELVLYALITDMGEEEAIDKLRFIADQWNIDLVESFKTATTDETLWRMADSIREIIDDREFIDALLKVMSYDEAKENLEFIWRTYNIDMLEDEEY